MNRLFALVISQLMLCSMFADILPSYSLTSTYLSENRGDSIVKVEFYDGLGRNIQTSTSGACTSGTFKMQYQSATFDRLGRPLETSLPQPKTVSGTTAVSYIPVSDLINTSYLYSKTTYDSWNRPIFKSSPGQTWHQQNKGITTTYQKNSTGTTSSVIKYEVTGTGLSISGTYPAGALYQYTTIDEDNNSVRTFVDGRGLTVLERRQAGGQYLDTYYVYDVYARLRYVLPPMCQDFTSMQSMQKYWYHYEYNDKGLCISKELPGCSAVNYYYDQDNRLSAMQDGNLRQSGKYRRYEYDGLGRIVRQFLHSSATGSSSTGEAEIINIYDDYTRVSQQMQGLQSRSFLLAPLTGTYRSNSHGKLLATWQALGNGTTGQGLWTVLYYDSKGLLAKSRQEHMNGRFIETASVYNFVGTSTQDSVKYYQRNSSGSYNCILATKMDLDYDFPHSSLLHRRTLSVDVSGNSSTENIQTFVYNNDGAVVSMNRGNTYKPYHVSYGYHPERKWLTRVSSSCGFVQLLHREDNVSHRLYNGSISAMEWYMPEETYTRRYDYTYDGASRLTNASYSQTAGAATYAMSSADEEGISVLSDELLASDTIPLILSRDSCLIELVPLHRDAGLNLASASSGADYGEVVTYDKNSNIKTLQRYGMTNSRSYGLIDQLTITRNGNQLSEVRDDASSLTYSGASDFQDGASLATEYSYDGNGSLTMDRNRGITSITYDPRGNLKQITFSGNRSIRYFYTADGTKIREIHTRPGVIVQAGSYSSLRRDTTDYLGSLIITNSHLDRFQFPDGYVSFNTSNAPDWHYYIPDYMGNVRMVINRNGSVEQENHYYPYGGLIGDLSTNQQVQKFRFEGKELDRQFGLDWYDIQARQYDAIGVPSWNKVDALAEKYPHLSPYVFAGGNPVNFGDYDGMDTQITINGKNITIRTALVITGQYTSKGIANQVKKDLTDTWGQISNFSFDNKTYNVNWDFMISSKQRVLQYKDGINYIEYNPGKNNSNAYKPSSVKASRNRGTLYNLTHMPHEFGHLLGISDQYYYPTGGEGGIPIPGYEGDIMAEPAGEGKASEKTIAPVLNNILEEHGRSIWNRIKDFLGIPTIYNVNIDNYSQPKTNTHKENKPIQ